MSGLLRYSLFAFSVAAILHGASSTDLDEAGIFSCPEHAIMSGPPTPACEYIDQMLYNAKHAFVRVGSEASMGYAIGNYSDTTNSVTGRRFSMMVEGSQLWLKVKYGKSHCDFAVKVEAGSVLGIKGSWEIQEAGITLDDNNKAPSCQQFKPIGKVGWVVSGDSVIWGDVAGAYDAGDKTATLWNDTPDPNDYSMVQIFFNAEGDLVRTEVDSDGDCDIPMDVVAGTVLGETGKTHQRRSSALRGRSM